MPLHLTKIAYRAQSVASLRAWLEEAEIARTATRYLPKRHEELAGGSLFWIFDHAIIGRSPLIGFAQREDGRWWIELEPRLIPVMPKAKRAHQGWRYLAAENAPEDLPEGAEPGEALPGRLLGKLTRLGFL